MLTIVITANIEKAFLMIEIDEKDRDALQFLWFNDVRMITPLLFTIGIVV